MLTPLILSGGSGTRLWPLSRELYPKQLLPLVGDKTMLQETVARVTDCLTSRRAIVVCNESHRFMVAEQMRQHGTIPAGDHSRTGRPQYGAGRRGRSARCARSRAQEQGRRRLGSDPAGAAGRSRHP